MDCEPLAHLEPMSGYPLSRGSAAYIKSFVRAFKFVPGGRATLVALPCWQLKFGCTPMPPTASPTKSPSTYCRNSPSRGSWHLWVSPQQVCSSPNTTGASLALRSSGLVRRAHRAQGQQSSCKHSMSMSTLSVKVSEGRFFKPRRLRHASGQLPRCG